MSETPTRTRRLWISLLVGLAVLVLSGYVAWGQFSDAAIYLGPYYALFRMDRVEKALDAYHEKNARFPTDIRQLWGATDLGYAHDSQNRPLDMWDHPLVYWSDGTRYRLVSLGQDGRSGGVGLNRDLSSDEFKPGTRTSMQQLKETERVTLLQFLTHHSAIRMLVVCSLGAVLSFMLAYRSFSPRVPEAKPRFRYSHLLRLLWITLAAVVVTVFISAFHVPSGH